MKHKEILRPKFENTSLVQEKMALSMPVRYKIQALLQGGEDSEDALSCKSFPAKEPVIIGLFCEK